MPGLPSTGSGVACRQNETETTRRVVMPKVVGRNAGDVPQKVKPFVAMGVDLDVGIHESIGTCPFCKRSRKFYVESAEGLWQCKVCQVKGNPVTFLRQLHQLAVEQTPDHLSEYAALAADRGLMFASTLTAWGVVRNPIVSDWLVPAYGADGKLHQLYRYSNLFDPKERRWHKTLIPTPGVWPDGQVHGIFAAAGVVHQLVTGKLAVQDAYLSEGPWDGMAWWESMRQVKNSQQNELDVTGSPDESLGYKCVVLAVPGANVFQEAWGPMMAGKRVQMMFDSDHPKIENGRTVDGSGLLGMRRVSEVLAVCPEQPELVRYLRWGIKGFDDKRRSGFDVRDWLREAGDTPAARLVAVRDIINSMFPIPTEWVAGRSPSAKKDGRVELEILKCESWADLVPHWQRWSPDGWPASGVGLDYGLAFALAVILSTEGAGDQLWGMVMGPPSSGKTTIAEALAVARKFVYPLSTLRGIYSGIKPDDGAKNDLSLILEVMNKTLVIKDGDTLMQSPNLIQILSELRDVYDRAGRTNYRTVGTRSYENVNLTILLHGTGQLHNLDHSEVGQRFLKCVVAEGVDFGEERRIALAKARNAARNLGKMTNCKAGSGEDKDYVTAKQYTAGYAEYLRNAAEDLLNSVHIGDSVEEMCADLGIFVACMRAQPARQKTEVAERELGYRLVSQLTRLVGCSAAVLNSPREIRDDIMDRVKRVASDTSHSSSTFKVVKKLYEEGMRGMGSESLAISVSETRANLDHLLHYLGQIRVVESFTPVTCMGVGQVRRLSWRLTDTVRGLYQRVMGV